MPLLMGLGSAPASAVSIEFVLDRGSTQNNASESSTAVDLATGASVLVGNYLIARVAADNSGTSGVARTLTVTDPRSNTWTVKGPANRTAGTTSDGASCWIAYAKVDNAYSNGDDVTFNYSGAITAKAIVVEEWTGIHPTTPEAVTSTTQTGSSTGPFVARTPTDVGQLFYSALAIEGLAADTYTQDTDVVDGPWRALTNLTGGDGVTAATSMTLRGAYKITGVTAQNWSATITSRDWAQIGMVFAPEWPGGVKGAQSVAASSSVSTLACVLPNNTLTGDLGVSVVVYNPTTQDCPDPSGWSLVNRQNVTGSMRVAVYKKILTTAEAGTSVTYTNTTAQRLACGVTVLDGVYLSDVDVVTGSAETGTTTTHASPTSPTMTVEGVEFVVYGERSSTMSTKVTAPTGNNKLTYAAGTGTGATGVSFAIDNDPVSAGSTVGGGSWVADVANPGAAMFTLAIKTVPPFDLVVANATQAHAAENVALGVDLTVAGASQAQAAETPTIVQQHNLTVQDTSQAQTSETSSLTQVHELTVDATTQIQTAENVALSQVHELGVQDSTQAQSSENATLTQEHNLTVADASQSQTSETPWVVVDLTLQAATQGQIADSPSLTQVHELAVDPATQTQSAETPGLTQVHVLTVSDAVQGETSDSVPITTETALGSVDALQGQTADSVVLTQDHFLLVDDAIQGQGAEEPGVNEAPNLLIDDVSHAQTADSPGLTQEHNLTVDPALQAESSDNSALTQDHILTVQDATQTQTSGSPTLVYNATLVPAAATQAQTSTQVAFTQIHVLTVQSATQSQVAGSPTLVVDLNVQSTTQAQAADRPLLTQQHNLTVQSATQSQTADQALITTEKTLAPADATQAQLADPVALTQEHNLAVQGATHAQTAESFPLHQTYQLFPDGSIQVQTADLVPITTNTTLVVQGATHSLTSTDAVLVPGGILTFYATFDGVTKTPVTIRGMWDGTTVRSVTTRGYFRPLP